MCFLLVFCLIYVGGVSDCWAWPGGDEGVWGVFSKILSPWSGRDSEGGSPLLDECPEGQAHRDAEYRIDIEPLASVVECEVPKKGYFSRAWHYAKGWWGQQTRKQKIFLSSVTVGCTVVVGVSLSGGGYLIFETVEAFRKYFAENAPGNALVDPTSGMVVAPTSMEVATSILAGSTGAVASSVATPTPTPTVPPIFGACDFVPPPRKFVNTGCGGAMYQGRCIGADSAYVCSTSGEAIHIDTVHGRACRCPRICKKPPVQLNCYYGGGSYCGHFPECDSDCDAVWCKTCGNPWDGSNIHDPKPPHADINNWLVYHGFRANRWVNSNYYRCN